MLPSVTLASIGLTGLALAAPVAYLSPQLARRSAVADLRRRCRAQRAVVMTYDDGPGPDLSTRLLDCLASHDARATFFMLGFRAEAHPETADRIVAAGHEAACHTMRHLHAWKSLPWQTRRDIRDGYEALERWVGPSGLFRPPYGKLNLSAWLELRRRSATPCWWTIDGRDAFDDHPQPEQIADMVAREGGGVVLLHDFDRAVQHAERSTYVLRTTDLVLARARREGLCARTLGTVLGASTQP